MRIEDVGAVQVGDIIDVGAVRLRVTALTKDVDPITGIVMRSITGSELLSVDPGRMALLDTP